MAKRFWNLQRLKNILTEVKKFSYKIEKNDLCYRLFKEHGFEWGGEWKDRKDYQHFELPTNIIEKLYEQ